MNKIEARKKLESVIAKIAAGDFVGGTEETRAALLKDINTDLQALAKQAKSTLTMEQIVDKHAAKVDVGGVNVPKGIHISIDEDLLTLNQFAEADKATQEAAIGAAETAGKLIIALAPLLLA